MSLSLEKVTVDKSVTEDGKTILEMKMRPVDRDVRVKDMILRVPRHVHPKKVDIRVSIRSRAKCARICMQEEWDAAFTDHVNLVFPNVEIGHEPFVFLSTQGREVRCESLFVVLVVHANDEDLVSDAPNIDVLTGTLSHARTDEKRTYDGPLWIRLFNGDNRVWVLTDSGDVFIPASPDTIAPSEHLEDHVSDTIVEYYRFSRHVRVGFQHADIPLGKATQHERDSCPVIPSATELMLEKPLCDVQVVRRDDDQENRLFDILKRQDAENAAHVPQPGTWDHWIVNTSNSSQWVLLRRMENTFRPMVRHHFEVSSDASELQDAGDMFVFKLPPAHGVHVERLTGGNSVTFQLNHLLFLWVRRDDVNTICEQVPQLPVTTFPVSLMGRGEGRNMTRSNTSVDVESFFKACEYLDGPFNFCVERAEYDAEAQRPRPPGVFRVSCFVDLNPEWETLKSDSVMIDGQFPFSITRTRVSFPFRNAQTRRHMARIHISLHHGLEHVESAERSDEEAIVNLIKRHTPDWLENNSWTKTNELAAAVFGGADDNMNPERLRVWVDRRHGEEEFQFGALPQEHDDMIAPPSVVAPLQHVIQLVNEFRDLCPHFPYEGAIPPDIISDSAQSLRPGTVNMEEIVARQTRVMEIQQDMVAAISTMGMAWIRHLQDRFPNPTGLVGAMVAAMFGAPTGETRTMSEMAGDAMRSPGSTTDITFACQADTFVDRMRGAESLLDKTTGDATAELSSTLKFPLRHVELMDITPRTIVLGMSAINPSILLFPSHLFDAAMVMSFNQATKVRRTHQVIGRGMERVVQSAVSDTRNGYAVLVGFRRLAVMLRMWYAVSCPVESQNDGVRTWVNRRQMVIEGGEVMADVPEDVDEFIDEGEEHAGLGAARRYLEAGGVWM